jgi:Putative adhesin
MKAIRFQSPVVLAATLALVLAAPAFADESSSSIAFSDPSKPGTLKIRVPHGAVTIHGGDVKEVTVASELAPVNSPARKDGMRVLSASASYALSEKGNVVSLEYGTDGFGGTPAEFEITVPRETSIVVANSAHGDFACTGVTGDIDVRTLSGDVNLREVSGGALVETLNGDITVAVKSLAPAKPLSFTSMNGRVTIRVPADAKAAIRFRTHRGVILTNFDDKALVTKTEISRRTPRKEQKAHSADKAQEGASPEEASDGADHRAKASEDSEGDWHAELRDSIREAADEAAMAAHEAAIAVHEGLAEARIEISGAIPPNSPIPPLPPMTGGKVVSGTLNGGGAEIQASTLNGDIVLKKAE